MMTRSPFGSVARSTGAVWLMARIGTIATAISAATRTHEAFNLIDLMTSLFQCQYQRAGRNQRDAKPIPRQRPLAQEEHREHRDQHDAEFVHRGDPRGLPELEGAEVAHP